MDTKNYKRGLCGLLMFSVFHFIYPQNKIARNNGDSAVQKSKWYEGPGIYVFGAYQLSAINIQRNPFSQTLFSGWSAGLVIKSKSNPHLLLEYGRTLKTKLSADWIDIYEQRINANALFEAYSNNNNRFMTLIGLTYKRLDGFYTGQLKTKEYSILYRENSRVRNTWLGLNVGFGYEISVDPFTAFAIIDVPVVWSDVGFGINDFIVRVGLKQKIPFRRIFKNSKDRYHWF